MPLLAKEPLLDWLDEDYIFTEEMTFEQHIIHVNYLRSDLYLAKLRSEYPRKSEKKAKRYSKNGS